MKSLLRVADVVTMHPMRRYTPVPFYSQRPCLWFRPACSSQYGAGIGIRCTLGLTATNGAGCSGTRAYQRDHCDACPDIWRRATMRHTRLRWNSTKPPCLRDHNSSGCLAGRSCLSGLCRIANLDGGGNDGFIWCAGTHSTPTASPVSTDHRGRGWPFVDNNGRHGVNDSG